MASIHGLRTVSDRSGNATMEVIANFPDDMTGAMSGFDAALF